MLSSVPFVLAGALLLFLIVLALPYCLACGIVAASRASKPVKIGMGVALLAFACLVGWELAFPPDENGVYIAHFVEVAQRPLPATARIVYKDSNLMNIRGRSWVRSRFELAPKEYATLLAAIRNDPSLKATAGQAGHFTRAPTEDNKYSRALEFLDDGKSIEVDFTN